MANCSRQHRHNNECRDSTRPCDKARMTHGHHCRNEKRLVSNLCGKDDSKGLAEGRLKRSYLLKHGDRCRGDYGQQHHRAHN
eukprot:4888017-Pleurochrysis_carterae.AAC.2